jgi:hypothetical protein
LSSKTTLRQTGAPVNSQFQVPDNVALFTDSRQSSAEVITRTSGSEVSKSIEADASFSASLMGVTASGSVSYDTSSDFKEDQQYAFLSQNVSGFAARISDYDTFVNANLIKNAAVLAPWSNKDSTVKKAYKALFEEYGTHIVETAYYG